MRTPRRRWLWLLLLDAAAWAVIALFFAAQGYLSSAYSGRPASWSSTLLYSVHFYAVWALLTPPVLWLAARVRPARRRVARFLAVHVPAGVAVSLLHAWLFAVLYWPRYSDAGRLDSPRALWGSMLAAHFHSNLLLYWLLVGGVLAAGTYAAYRDREARLARAELQALRAQLHPHFLFNSLNTISSLVREEPLAAERMISRLGDLLRITLGGHRTDEVPLRQELDFVDRYLEIEQTRFGDRLRVERRVEPAALDALVPHLVLQPLVENALRHGVAPRRAGATVEIRAARQGGLLTLEVRDDGAGAPAGMADGVGLANTRARLERLYGAGHRFEARPAQPGFAVLVEIPFRNRSGRTT